MSIPERIKLTRLSKQSGPVFVLRPSGIHGVGVFAVMKISKGTFLPLFSASERVVRRRLKKQKADQYLRWFGVQDAVDAKVFHCPVDYHRMSIGWYLNHSPSPNAAHKNFRYYSLCDIADGDEITIDYRTLGEKEPFDAGL
jgi:SET domain-containing protein